MLVGHGCAVLGDDASAALEFDNARETFESLGAEPDLHVCASSRADPSVDQGCAVGPGAGGAAPGGRGKTSREIASSLTISQHTVRRHLENTFAKLGVNSRAAAVASAYEHDLL